MNEEKLNTDAVEPATVRKIRRRRAATVPLQKIGLDKNIGAISKRDMMKKVFDRKMKLTIPKAILDANPDKHFVWLNMNRLEKSGMWHTEGYEVFKANENLPDHLTNKFNRSADNYIHRNEMVLGYIPMEEYKLRKDEWDFIHGGKDITEIITNNPDLRAFSPTANETKEFVQLAKEEE